MSQLELKRKVRQLKENIKIFLLYFFILYNVNVLLLFLYDDFFFLTFDKSEWPSFDMPTTGALKSFLCPLPVLKNDLSF